MKVAFDHQTFALQSYGGISRYFVRLAEQFINGGHEVRVFAPLHRNRYLDSLPQDVVQGRRLERFPRGAKHLILAYNHLTSRRPMQTWRPQIVHETYYARRRVAPRYCPTVITVYDMIHELFAEEFSTWDTTSERKKMAIDRADHVISISGSTRRDLMRLFGTSGDKISVIHLGFEQSKHEASMVRSDEEEQPRPYLLYVGERGGYKNFIRFIRAVASSSFLMRDFDVVAFGGGGFSATERELIASLGFHDDQVRQAFGGDEILGRLYDNAHVFVYPSLYEGFGLPLLEAMGHRCPVASSNTSSMPEVIGEAAEYFIPLDLDDMRRAIETAAYSVERRADLIAAGIERLAHFSWEKCARETLAVYQTLMA